MNGNSQTPQQAASYKLPPLHYGYNDLEPHISGQIMEIHHSKHHQAYVTNLNNALKSYKAAMRGNDIRQQLKLQSVVRFNAGGHINHSIFWLSLAPTSAGKSDPAKSAPRLLARIKGTFGSYDEFKNQFNSLLNGLQGSGWGWLVYNKLSGGLEIISTKDQNTVSEGKVPLLGIDMWEHAYYLQYLNGKASYIAAIWNVIDWGMAEQRYVDYEWWDQWRPLMA